MHRTRAQQLWLGAGTGSESKATDVKNPYAVGATLVVMCYICNLCNAAAAITAVRTVDFSIIASITAQTAQLKGIADSTKQSKHQHAALSVAKYRTKTAQLPLWALGAL